MIDTTTRTTWTDPVLSAAGVTVLHGDCIEVLSADENGYPYDLGYGTRHLIADESIDSVVTDPPYGLDFMGNDWDAPGKMLGQLATGLEQRGAFAYGGTHSRGYAGHDGLAFEAWCSRWAAEAHRVLKPGGHLLAFGGSRTWHRLASGVEDAGFELRDSIAWLYAQGFPKSLDVAQAVDQLDAAGERLARAREFQTWMREHITPARIDELTGTHMGYHLTTHPTQPAVATADVFDVLRDHLPAVPERIEHLVAQRTVDSANHAAREVVGEHRSGVTRGDAGVTAGGEGKARTVAFTEQAQEWEGWGTNLKPAFEPIVVARKPLAGTVAATVVAHRTGALNIDANRTPMSQTDQDAARVPMRAASPAKVGTEAGRGDDRFEPSSSGRWPTNVLLDEHQAAELDRQAPNAGGASPASGPTLRDPQAASVAYGARNGLAGDPAFYGDTGGASRMFPTFRFEPKAPTSERPKVDGVAHPTVKPLALMQWLVRLVTAKGGTVLEPFAGSGTTVEACLREGFDCIAIEREANYLPLIRRRVQKDHAQGLDFDWGDDGR